MDNKTWLAAKPHRIGPFIRMARPEVVEILATAGFDFGVVDLEHGATAHMNDIYPLILAAELKGMRLVARIPGVSEMYIKWLLDLGIGGLQIPHIKTREDAETAVSYARFSPAGARGLCRFVRAAGFSSIPRETYIGTAHEQSLLILQIEGVEGAANIEAIAAVPGVDIIFIGPYDLSQSMGVPGQIWHPKVTEEMQRIISVCRSNQVATGVFTDTPEGVAHWKKLGVNYINYRIDTELLFDFARRSLQELEPIQ